MRDMIEGRTDGKMPKGRKRKRMYMIREEKNHGQMKSDVFIRTEFALCTNPPLAAISRGCLVVVPILGSGM